MPTYPRTARTLFHAGLGRTGILGLVRQERNRRTPGPAGSWWPSCSGPTMKPRAKERVASLFSDVIGGRPAGSLVVSLRAPPVVALGHRAGGCAGRCREAEPPPEHDRESVHHFVPVPQAASLLVLSSPTATLTLATAFVDLFDAIAESLHWRS